jgi:hypothetical protein
MRYGAAEAVKRIPDCALARGDRFLQRHLLKVERVKAIHHQIAQQRRALGGGFPSGPAMTTPDLLEHDRADASSGSKMHPDAEARAALDLVDVAEALEIGAIHLAFEQCREITGLRFEELCAPLSRTMASKPGSRCHTAKYDSSAGLTWIAAGPASEMTKRSTSSVTFSACRRDWRSVS